LAVGTLALSGVQASAFALQSDHCSGQTVAPGATCTASVHFAPDHAGGYAAQLDVPDNTAAGVEHVAISGVGGVPAASAVPVSFDRDETKPVAIANASDTQLNVSGATIAGSDAAHFAIVSSFCGHAVPPGSACSFSVSFASAQEGSFHAQLVV